MLKPVCIAQTRSSRRPGSHQCPMVNRFRNEIWRLTGGREWRHRGGQRRAAMRRSMLFYLARGRLTGCGGALASDLALTLVCEGGTYGGPMSADGLLAADSMFLHYGQ